MQSEFEKTETCPDLISTCTYLKKIEANRIGSKFISYKSALSIHIEYNIFRFIAEDNKL